MNGRVKLGETAANDSVKPLTNGTFHNMLGAVFVVRFDLCGMGGEEIPPLCKKVLDVMDIAKKCFYFFCLIYLQFVDVKHAVLVITHLELKSVEKRKDYISKLTRTFNIPNGYSFQFFFNQEKRLNRNFKEDVATYAIFKQTLQNAIRYL